MPPDRISGWLNSACWTVSCISLQSASYYAKNTDDEQLGNVKDIHQSDFPHRQWFDRSLLTFWNCFLIKKRKKEKRKENALLSLFLTAYHYSLGVFFPAKDTKAGAIEGCQTWMSFTLSVTECMSSLDIYISASNLKPSKFSRSVFSW